MNNQTAKKVFGRIFDEDIEPISYIEEKRSEICHGYRNVGAGCGESAGPKIRKTAEEYQSGKTKVLGFLVGQVMKEMRGKADPQAVNRLLTEKLQ